MYRLIWFQHLHKAAGTLVVNLARANGEVLYPNNANGNPQDDDGNRIELWKYTAGELHSFINECEDKGVTFVATEHGSPDFQTLYDDDRIVLLTTLREPYSRALSNYNYAYFAGYTDSRDLSEFLEENRIFMSDNYYVRSFARKERFPLEGLSEEDFEIALAAVSLFDLVLIVGRDDLKSRLVEELGWEDQSVDSHSTYGDFWNVWNMLKKGRVLRVVRYLLRKNAPGDVALLNKRYDFDIRLLEGISGK